MSGVNDELFPLLRMTCPEEDTRITSHLVQTRQGQGQRKTLFNSWMLLFGVFPFEVDWLNITTCIDGVMFSERSSMMLMSEWHHDRMLETICEGTKVTDVLSFSPRWGLGFMGYFMRNIVTFLFNHRHNRLKSKFGTK